MIFLAQTKNRAFAHAHHLGAICDGSFDQSAGMTGQSTSRKPAGLARVLPIVDWLPRYQGGWLRPDLISGITVAALVVPKALGYAGIAV